MNIYEKYKVLLKKFLENILKIEKKDEFYQYEKKSHTYFKQIQDIINKNRGIFSFDLKNLYDKNFPQEIKWLFFSNTKRFIKILSECIYEIIHEKLPFATLLKEDYILYKLQLEGSFQKKKC